MVPKNKKQQQRGSKPYMGVLENPDMFAATAEMYNKIFKTQYRVQFTGNKRLMLSENEVRVPIDPNVQPALESERDSYVLMEQGFTRIALKSSMRNVEDLTHRIPAHRNTINMLHDAVEARRTLSIMPEWQPGAAYDLTEYYARMPADETSAESVVWSVASHTQPPTDPSFQQLAAEVEPILASVEGKSASIVSDAVNRLLNAVLTWQKANVELVDVPRQEIRNDDGQIIDIKDAHKTAKTKTGKSIKMTASSKQEVMGKPPTGPMNDPETGWEDWEFMPEDGTNQTQDYQAASAESRRELFEMKQAEKKLQEALTGTGLFKLGNQTKIYTRREAERDQGYYLGNTGVANPYSILERRLHTFFAMMKGRQIHVPTDSGVNLNIDGLIQRKAGDQKARLFWRRAINEGLFVAILVDSSSSMTDRIRSSNGVESKIDVAKNLFYTLANAMADVPKLKVEFFAYNGITIELDAADVKDVRASGGTDTGGAIRLITDRMRKYKGGRKIIFHISDGDANHEQDTADAIRDSKKMGIDMFNIILARPMKASGTDKEITKQKYLKDWNEAFGDDVSDFLGMTTESQIYKTFGKPGVDLMLAGSVQELEEQVFKTLSKAVTRILEVK